MPRSVSARLTTLCGCRQFIAITAPAPSEHRVQIGLRGSTPADATDVPVYRRFKLVAFNPPDCPVEADYVEVPE